MQGKVKWFSEEKGYGYIVADDDGQDHYFHVRDILGADLPKNGSLVNFESTQQEKGIRATLVSIISNTEHFASNQNHDSRITCVKCEKKMTPRLWHYAPLRHSNAGLTKGMRHMKTQHLCPYCGTCQYESGGELSLYGKFIVTTILIIFFLGAMAQFFI